LLAKVDIIVIITINLRFYLTLKRTFGRTGAITYKGQEKWDKAKRE
jgi:hypothetical protein